jgi:hypothetical protein
MLDNNAPIIPGVSAAGFYIGQFIERKGPIGALFVRESIRNSLAGSSEEVRYHSESVDLWVANNVIQQIGVHGTYHGMLLDHITLGMTIEDIERRISPCMEDDEDKLAIAGVEGLCFEVAWRQNHPAKELDLRLPELRVAPITRLFVCQSQAFVQYRSHALHQASWSGSETALSRSGCRAQVAQALQACRLGLRQPGVAWKRLVGASEVGAREIARNPQFGREVRQVYDELMQMQARPAPRTTNLEPLEAIRHTGKNIDPYGPPNPQDLIYAYGEDKLGRALQDYTMDRLKMAVETIQREYPGTKPASKTKKSALIDYIVEYSTNGHK